MKSKYLALCVRDPKLNAALIIAASRRDFILVPCKRKKKKGGPNLAGFFSKMRVGHPVAVSDWSCTYTWYWATVADGQQDIPSDYDLWW